MHDVTQVNHKKIVPFAFRNVFGSSHIQIVLNLNRKVGT
jgi:hypothetical protein